MMIALFRSFSWPLISFLSSGIDVKPSRAKRTTPIGVPICAGFHVVRFAVLMIGRNFTNIPRTIATIAMTPHVSIFFRPFRPSLRSNVITSQNMIPKIIGGMFPGISLDRDWPSPIRYARRAEYTPNIIAKNIIRLPHGPRYFSA